MYLFSFMFDTQSIHLLSGHYKSISGKPAR